MRTIKAKESNYQKGRTGGIKYIVIHYTASPNDTALGEAKYFAHNYIGASAHFFVDENEVVQSVDVKDTAWHCEGANRFYSLCRNSNSIGIELCCRKYNMTTKNATDKDWYFLENTVKNAAEIARELVTKYNIPIQNIIRHYDVTHKICPAPYVHDERQWELFLNKVKGEEEVVEIGKININGKNYDIETILKDGHNYIRLDSLKNMGFDVGYSAVKKIPSLGVKVEKVIMSVDGREQEMNRILKFDENYVRLRDLSDVLDIEYVDGQVTISPKN
ncbi:MAG: N-acetylmuramoyl-L-alanine amidase [Firmicutes bacterium]|nr:N-acetylmuramoyl-L-alanine amidase [Bacillota bacterium]